MNQVSTATHIEKIRYIVTCPTIEVVEGMVAYRMARLRYLPESVRVSVDVFTHAEKSSFGLVPLQLLQHPGSHLWNGAVVESQVQHLFPGRNSPGKIREQLLYEKRRFYEVHRVSSFRISS